MARPSILTNPQRLNLRIESEVLQAGRKRSKVAGYSFGEYVSRLINADLSRKNTIAHRFTRNVGKA